MDEVKAILEKRLKKLKEQYPEAHGLPYEIKRQLSEVHPIREIENIESAINFIESMQKEREQ